jgi:hypothetical protein
VISPPSPTRTLVLPALVVLGAPGTGANVLCAAVAGLAQTLEVGIFCSEGDLSDPLVAAALQQEHTTTLLMGLDQPWAPADRPAQEAADAGLRAALASAGATFHVVYGDEYQRTAQAVNAIKSIATRAYPSSDGGHFEQKSEAEDGRFVRLRAWNCEKCSDPECEHRLFRTLTGRGAAADR